MDLRSISGYIPLDFAVVGKKKNWKLARMLDDRHLLPRAEFPRLEKCIIEVWRKKNTKQPLKLIVAKLVCKCQLLLL